MLTLLFSMPLVFLVYIPGMIFFLRFLMEYAGVDFYHPFSQLIFKITAPFLKVFNNLHIGNINVAALLNMILLSYVLICVFFMKGFSTEAMAVMFVGNLFFVIWMIMELLIILLIITAVLSWIPSAYRTSVYFMTMLKPLTGVFDRFIPRICYISLSFLVVFLLMQFIDGTVMPRLLFMLIQRGL